MATKNKHLSFFESGIENVEAFRRMILAGDPRCPIPIGARVEKQNSEAGDANADGKLGYVRASAYNDHLLMPCYWVEWDEFVMPDPAEHEFILPYMATIQPKLKHLK
jgi:hypothetical protein